MGLVHLTHVKMAPTRHRHVTMDGNPHFVKNIVQIRHGALIAQFLAAIATMILLVIPEREYVWTEDVPLAGWEVNA